MPNSLYLRNRCLRSSISYLYADGVMIVTSRDATPYDFVNLNGGSGGGRTHALRIKSPLPYHLATEATPITLPVSPEASSAHG